MVREVGQGMRGLEGADGGEHPRPRRSRKPCERALECVWRFTHLDTRSFSSSVSLFFLEKGHMAAIENSQGSGVGCEGWQMTNQMAMQ